MSKRQSQPKALNLYQVSGSTGAHHRKVSSKPILSQYSPSPEHLGTQHLDTIALAQA